MPRTNGAAAKRPSPRQVKQAARIKEPRSATALLKADKRGVEGLFKAFKKTESAAEKRDLAERICDVLIAHMRIEDEIFHPAFIEAVGNRELHAEALVEHDAAKKLIAEIEGSSAEQSERRLAMNATCATIVALGNDPAQQSTGEGSNPENEPPPQSAPQPQRRPAALEAGDRLAVAAPCECRGSGDNTVSFLYTRSFPTGGSLSQLSGR